jgi:hypothetical protein
MCVGFIDNRKVFKILRIQKYTLILNVVIGIKSELGVSIMILKVNQRIRLIVGSCMIEGY